MKIHTGGIYQIVIRGTIEGREFVFTELRSFDSAEDAKRFLNGLTVEAISMEPPCIRVRQDS